MGKHTFILKDEEATRRLAEALAPSLGAGDCILLAGPVGAGKSAFARAIIQTRLAALGQTEDVPSPTFTLVQTYALAETEIWHADLYRLGHSSELYELGLDDAIEEAIVLIEWPERLGELAPEAALTLTLETTGDDSRNGTLSWTQARWSHRLKHIINDQEQTRIHASDRK